MIETFLGPSSPIWTAIPSAAFALQTPFVGGPGINSPLYGSPTVPGLATGLPTSPQTVFGVGGFPGGTYGWPSGGMMPGVPQGAAVPTVPFVAGPSASLVGSEMMMGVTASSLLAAVAMRRGQLQGPTNDQEVEEFIYDVLDLLPGSAEVEVRCEGGRVTFTGSVQYKRLKRDIGEIAWTIPAVTDVQNNVTVAPRRRVRAATREAEAASYASMRK